MKAFVVAVMAAAALAVLAAIALNVAQRPAYRVFATEGTRVGDPGENLVGQNWNGSNQGRSAASPTDHGLDRLAARRLASKQANSASVAGLPLRAVRAPRTRRMVRASRTRPHSMGHCGPRTRPSRRSASCAMSPFLRCCPLCVRLGAGPSGATLVRRIARDEPPPLQQRTYRGLPDVLDGVQLGRGLGPAAAPA